MIKAPYNFVPLNEHVFFPDWADKVSHDVPFSDGESGCITIKLTAKSPVYVRNGGAWSRDNQARNQDSAYQSFSEFDNKYFIPATSIKGMIRNVLEIISFGKMGEGRVNDHRYSYRDISGSKISRLYREEMSGKENGAFKPKVKTGWLHGVPGALQLTPCEFSRVDHGALHSHFGKSIELGTPRKTATDKYDIIKNSGKSLDIKFDVEQKDGEPKVIHEHSSGKKLWYRKAINLGKGSEEGTLVFTGQPNTTKHMEFIFYKPGSGTLEIDETMEKDFFFIHSKNGIPNNDLSHWLGTGNQIEHKIPVFYLTNNDDSIRSIGLAMMYRLAFDNSVHDLLPSDHMVKDKPDLAELLFGTIAGDSLKGRIHFSHAFANMDTAVKMEPVTRTLGSPKASFTLSYLRDGASYRDNNAQLKGRKRYPVHPQNSKRVVGNQEQTSKTTTTFIPLSKDVEFTCKIRFHNLRKAEIGALLSALTFHGNEKDVYHSLGMAKPLGCGKMALAIKDIVATKLKKENLTEYFYSFVKNIEDAMKRRAKSFLWRGQPQIYELLTMGCEQTKPSGTEAALSYMRFSNTPAHNEFTTAKSQNQNMKYYSDIVGILRKELPATKDEIFHQAVITGDKENVLKFFKSLTAEDIACLQQVNLSDNNIFNIGFVDNLLALEMDDKCKQLICFLLAKKIKQNKNWNETKKDRYAKLKQCAASWNAEDA